jgi:RNA polymerase sigma-70 factor, ECF subfamily
MDEASRASGEAGRFESLYVAHFERVAAYLVARTDRDTAADVLASTFEIAWRRLPDVPDDSLPWLVAVARRVLANARRASGRQAALVERIAGAARELSPDLAEGGLPEQLAVAISHLTASQQEALLLIAWDGLTEREAAVVLGCTRGAFAARLHRARERVRSAMTEAIDEKRSEGGQANGSTDRVPAGKPIEEAT